MQTHPYDKLTLDNGASFIESFRENPLIDAKRRRWDESE